MPIAPSTYRAQVARRRDPATLPARARRDAALMPEIARVFPPDLAALVGYRQHRPNLGNFEGQCPSVLLGEPADRPLGAVDALRPDQQVLVDAYVERKYGAQAPA